MAEPLVNEGDAAKSKRIVVSNDGRCGMAASLGGVPAGTGVTSPRAWDLTPCLAPSSRGPTRHVGAPWVCGPHTCVAFQELEAVAAHRPDALVTV